MRLPNSDIAEACHVVLLAAELRITFNGMNVKLSRLAALSAAFSVHQQSIGLQSCSRSYIRGYKRYMKAHLLRDYYGCCGHLLCSAWQMQYDLASASWPAGHCLLHIVCASMSGRISPIQGKIWSKMYVVGNWSVCREHQRFRGPSAFASISCMSKWSPWMYRT